MKKVLLLILSIIIFSATNIAAQNNTEINLTQIELKTDSGIIRLVLYNETKLHKENFIKLIKEGYYDGQLFHRLIKNFMIQGGDPDSKNAVKGQLLGQGGPEYTIPAEINAKYFHKKGSLAAARKGNNINPIRASSGSQFYIVQGVIFSELQLDEMVAVKRHVPFTETEKLAYTKYGGSPHLDGEYTIFGEVIEGFEVLEKLMNIPVDANNRPVTDLKFTLNIIE